MAASESQSDQGARARARVCVFCSNTPGAKLFVYAAVRKLQAGPSELLGFHLFVSIREVYGNRARNQVFGSFV